MHAEHIRILVVDDESAIRESLGDYLEDRGYDVRKADGGQDALAAFQHEQYDLVQTDLRMPGTDGLEVLRSIRESSPETPVIVISGTGRISDVVHALRLGAWDYILKPVEDMSMVTLAMERALDRARLQKENRKYQANLEKLVEERTRELERELSVRKQTEEALRLAHDRIKIILEKTPAGVVIIDRTKHIIWANETTCQMAGVSSMQDLAGKPCFDYLCPAQQNECPIIDKGQIVDHSERILRRRDGSELPIIKSVVETQIDGEDVLIETFVDITDRKAAEVRLLQLNTALNEAKTLAEEASIAKSQFLANMSHELRTPMNGILGFADLLMESSPDEQTYEFSSIIHSSAKTLLRVINDVLDFAKLEAGKLSLKITDFDLRDLIGRISAPFQAQAQAKKMDYASSVAPDVPNRLRGDADRIGQILTNLLGNAIKFTHKGQIGLHVRLDGTGADEAGNVLLRFAVNDTGIGIPANKMSKLFVKFSQVDGSHTRSYGGTGLGLSISKELAEMMGGHIVATSTEGEGSEFSAIIPLALQVEKGTPPPSKKETFDRSTKWQGHALVVEDNYSNQLAATMLLEQAGMHVDVVDGGNQAIRALENTAYDIVFMDLQMPAMDGYETTRRIRKREIEQSLSPVPIVALTAHALEGVRENCLASGMNDYLAKPVELEDLAAVLNRFLPAAAPTGEQPA